MPGEDRVTVDPRVGLAFTTEDWTLRLGTGMFQQGRWRLRYTLPGSGAPGGIPTSAQHLVAGVEHAGEPSLRVEGYLKKYGSYVQDGDGPQAQSGSSGRPYVMAVAARTHRYWVRRRTSRAACSRRCSVLSMADACPRSHAWMHA